MWDPHTHKHVKDIEGIQRRAARFVKGCYVRVPGTVTNLLKNLEWSPLQQRRQMSRLRMMYKIVNNQSCPVQISDYLQKKTRVTQSFHPKHFINLGSQSNTYKYSCFIRTGKEWNGLPDELIEQETPESFKSALANYLNHWPFFVFFVSLLFDWFTLALALVTAPLNYLFLNNWHLHYTCICVMGNLWELWNINKCSWTEYCCFSKYCFIVLLLNTQDQLVSAHKIIPRSGKLDCLKLYLELVYCILC